MKFFKTLFHNSSSEAGIQNNEENWERIKSEHEINDLIKRSNTSVHVIFKHSPYCGTSLFAVKVMDRVKARIGEKPSFYLIDVIAERNISNSIANELSIKHESPQILILVNEEVIWHGSHQEITEEAVMKILSKEIVTE